MQTIGEYTILKKLGETRGSIVYRGTKEGSPSRETVTIKVLKTKDPAPSEITRFKLEYEIIRSLDIEGIVQTYDFLSHEGTYALVLEDFEGISLRKVIDSRKIKVPEFLDMAIALAGGLGNLHKNNIIHKDIKPSNILVNSSTGIIKITDFGISSLLTHENIEIYHPDVIQGTLTYMSPEQTGRMNREVDYRSDFYSLGITLYEMLTGFVPFKSVDPLEIIHCHIARHPVSPIDRDQALPLILSQIIMKLISKNAEERYQNSFGLMADLEECRNRQRETGSIEEFELGLRDIPIKFRKPGILVGREKEIDILLNAFQRVTGEGEDNRAEIMLVAGAPGIGKSSLVSEVDKLVVAERGYFITGKYDQFKWDVPYSAIIDVFKELVSRILTEKEEMIQTWKEQLLKAVGPNGKILTDVIPTIKLIIGPQPDVPELEPEQAFNRFNVVFKNCAHVVAQAEHPVVIFLDDLQWADPASLKLLKTIITDPGIQYLFLIGAYRDTEVDTNHILTRTLLEIEKEGVPVERIQLDSLNNDTVNRFIAAFFKSKENETRSLAELVHKKTGGNPFFINQFLKTLYEEGM
ncbi:MAG: AAA family ATPase, partial [bacterium]|nr:AAA family ATPase [bacterium]